MQLYSTSGCHLCEEAEALLRHARQRRATLDWQVVDIADDDALFERYGWLIPVLHARSGSATNAPATDEELRWPFDGAALEAFLERVLPG